MQPNEDFDDLFELDDATLAERLGVTAEDVAVEMAVIRMVQSYGDQVKAMRTLRGWSRDKLAERIGVSATRVAQLESGTLRNAISLKTFAKIAYVLNFVPRCIIAKSEDVSTGSVLESHNIVKGEDNFEADFNVRVKAPGLGLNMELRDTEDEESRNPGSQKRAKT